MKLSPGQLDIIISTSCSDLRQLDEVGGNGAAASTGEKTDEVEKRASSGARDSRALVPELLPSRGFPGFASEPAVRSGMEDAVSASGGLSLWIAEKSAADTIKAARRAQQKAESAARSPYLVTPRGTVLPPAKDYNLVSDDPRKWMQIQGTHPHRPHGQPHTHVPEVHQRPDGSLGSTRRATDVTTAGDIDYADDALRKGELWPREKGRR